MAELILAEQTLAFEYFEDMGVYAWEYLGDGIVFALVEGQTYTVVWDGNLYSATAKEMTLDGVTGIGLGNEGIFGLGEDNGQPFLFGYVPDYSVNACYSNVEGDTHTVAIYMTTGANIVTYDRNGQPVIHTGIETVSFNTDVEGEVATYYLDGGNTAEGVSKEVELNLADGDQTVEADPETLMSEVIIKKPVTLLPENIANGVNIAGVVGTLESGGGDSEGFSLNPVFSENDWLAIAGACVANQVPDTWAVGDQKTMTIGGKDYAIDIIGKNHDTYTVGGGIAPLTFQLHDCMPTVYTMNDTATNIGGYDSSKMFKKHLPAIKKLMPSDIQAAIRYVDKKSTIGGADYGNNALETISCDIFLLSQKESTNTGSYDDGVQYEYYRAGAESRKKYIVGTSDVIVGWWNRSPNTTDAERFYYTDKYGWQSSQPANSTAANTWTDKYVSFAFCF